MTKQELAEYAALYWRCCDDPVVFARDVLGVDTWWQQDEILRSIFKNRETAVRSCHASGKTKLAAVATLAWLRLHKPGEALVVTTSSSWEQVESEVWREIHVLIGQSKALKGWDWPKPNRTRLEMPGGSLALGLSTNQPVNFHGFHAPKVLIIIDEASGIDAEIYSAINGIKAGGRVSTLYLMNPTEASGPSVDLFDDPKVEPFIVDGLKSPNMEGLHIYETPELNDSDPEKNTNLLYLPDAALDDNPRPYLITRRFIKDLYQDAIRKFGQLKPEADWWPRVRGEFPREALNQLISRTDVEKAHQRGLTDAIPLDRLTIVGIDVAGPGKNETAICVRSGYKILRQMSWSQIDPYDEVVRVIGDPRPTLWIYVDATGIGYGLFSALIRAGYQVVPCNAANRPNDPTRFLNAKAEWYWKLREHFQDGDIYGPIDPLCQSQLLSIRWDQNNTKRLVRIEPKADAEKRGIPSPDRAEAMMLCFAGGPMSIRTGEIRYDQNVITQGTAATVNGPGWESGIVAQQSQKTPRAMEAWLKANFERKQANQGSIRAVLGQTTDPTERARLMEMLQPADG